MAPQSRPPAHGNDDAQELFIISVAAERVGMHVQTLRAYDRMGLVSPIRTEKGDRRYTADDLELLRTVQRLSRTGGVNRAGIREILRLVRENQELNRKNSALERQLSEIKTKLHDAYSTAGTRGRELVHVPRSTAVVMWDSSPRARRAARRGTTPHN